MNIHTTLRWPFVRSGDKEALERGVGMAALVGTTIAGSTYNAFAMPLTGVLSPLSLLFISEVLTAFFILFSFGVVPTFRSLLRTPGKLVVPLLAIGLLSSVLGPLLWFVGLHYSGAVNASLYGKIDLVIMMLLARLFLGERYGRRHILAAAVIIAGLFVVSCNKFVNGVSLQPTDFVLVLSVSCYACGSVVFRKYLHDVQPHVALFVRSLVAMSVFFLLAPFLRHPFIEEMSALPATLIPTLLAFGFVSRFLNVFFYYQAVDRLPVMTVSMFITLEVIGSMFFAFWYLGESLEWYHIAGALLIILGNLMLEISGVHPSKKYAERHLRQRSHRT